MSTRYFKFPIEEEIESYIHDKIRFTYKKLKCVLCDEISDLYFDRENDLAYCYDCLKKELTHEFFND